MCLICHTPTRVLTGYISLVITRLAFSFEQAIVNLEHHTHDMTEIFIANIIIHGHNTQA